MSDPTNDDDDAVLTAQVESYRRRTDDQVAAIKDALATWLEPRENEADSVCITRALLEVALAGGAKPPALLMRCVGSCPRSMRM